MFNNYNRRVDQIKEKMTKKSIFTIVSLALVAALASSCRHKGLGYTTRMDVNINVDWTGIPGGYDKKPVRAYLFPSPATVAKDPKTPIKRSTFSRGTGGTFKEVREGSYKGLTFNTDYACVTLIEDRDWNKVRITLEENSKELPQGYKKDDAFTYLVEPATGEFVSCSPDNIYVGKHDDYNDVPVTNRPVTLPTIKPKLITKTVNIKVANVTNVEDIRDVSGSLSGVSIAYFPGTETTSDTPATSIFDMKAIAEPKNAPTVKEIKGTMATFGFPSRALNIKNILVLYVKIKDGSSYYYPYDVTDQITPQINSNIINIDIASITIPKSKKGGGMGIGLDDFEEENIGVPM